jgi:hypothetical protein
LENYLESFLGFAPLFAKKKWKKKEMAEAIH